MCSRPEKYFLLNTFQLQPYVIMRCDMEQEQTSLSEQKHACMPASYIECVNRKANKLTSVNVCSFFSFPNESVLLFFILLMLTVYLYSGALKVIIKCRVGDFILIHFLLN